MEYILAAHLRELQGTFIAINGYEISIYHIVVVMTALLTLLVLYLIWTDQPFKKNKSHFTSPPNHICGNRDTLMPPPNIENEILYTNEIRDSLKPSILVLSILKNTPKEFSFYLDFFRKLQLQFRNEVLRLNLPPSDVVRNALSLYDRFAADYVEKVEHQNIGHDEISKINPPSLKSTNNYVKTLEEEVLARVLNKDFYKLFQNLQNSLLNFFDSSSTAIVNIQKRPLLANSVENDNFDKLYLDIMFGVLSTLSENESPKSPVAFDAEIVSTGTSTKHVDVSVARKEKESTNGDFGIQNSKEILSDGVVANKEIDKLEENCT